MMKILQSQVVVMIVQLCIVVCELYFNKTGIKIGEITQGESVGGKKIIESTQTDWWGTSMFRDLRGEEAKEAEMEWPKKKRNTCMG